jgi:DNA helicase IV
LTPPISVRATGTSPSLVRVDSLVEGVTQAVDRERSADRMVAVICPAEDTDAIHSALGPGTSRADHGSLHGDLVVVPAYLSKGLEFDTVIVAEPAGIVADTGYSGLYVALTRATDRLVVVHSEPLPGLYPTEPPL